MENRKSAILIFEDGNGKKTKQVSTTRKSRQ